MESKGSGVEGQRSRRAVAVFVLEEDYGVAEVVGEAVLVVFFSKSMSSPVLAFETARGKSKKF